MRWCCGASSSSSASEHSTQMELNSERLLTTTTTTAGNGKKQKASKANGGKGSAASVIVRQGNSKVQLLSGKSSSPSGAMFTSEPATTTAATAPTNNSRGVLKSSLRLLTQRPSKGVVKYADEVEGIIIVDRDEDEDEYDEEGRQKDGEEEPHGAVDGNHYSGGGKRRQSPGYSTAMEGSSLLQQQKRCSINSPPQQHTPTFGGRSSGAAAAFFQRQRLSLSQLDKYGPMLLTPCKSALFVTAPSLTAAQSQPQDECCSTAASTSAALPKDCPFLGRLLSTGWTLHVSSPSTAAIDVRRHRPVAILVDYKLDDLISFSTSLRSQPEAEDVLFGVLLGVTPSESDIERLAKADLQQFFLRSSTDISLCELFARIASRLRAIPALFAVVEETEQPIKICDERNVVQYVNRAYEVVTGQTRSDVLGSDASDMRFKNLNNVSAVPSSAPSAGWSSATVTPTEPEMPFAGGLTTSAGSQSGNGYNNLRRRSSEWHCITVPSTSTNPQFVYVKRGSGDGAAMCRDLSMKSLRSSQSALVDAPITEALSVLNSVIHKCDDETQMQVRDAIKILSSSELYAPSITRFRDNDRIASGYYDGLIRLHHPARQRKRSVVDAFRENQHQRRVSGGSNTGGATIETKRRISTDVANALSNENQWNFDVLELERITDHHPLSSLGVKIFDRWSVAETLKCSPDNIARWLTVIEANYQSSNAYHNATHAADVLQATSYFLDSESVGQFVQDMHAVAALIAATVHDLDHPGRGNAFLMNTRQRLALLYNDQSVLENHHVALAFQLTLAQPGVNVFARLTRDEFIRMRQAIIDMVLATDMSRHFEHLTKFQQLMGNLPDNEDNRDANSLTICRMMIKCADIANPTREWKLCYQWAMRIVQEYFDQTSEESSKGLPLTMKGFDRETCNIPITQCTFVDMFARETFISWCEFSEYPELLTQLEANYEIWKSRSADWDPSQNMNLPRCSER